MHNSSFQLMKRLYDKYGKEGSGICYDVGAYDVNGSYKPLIGNNYKYIGLDIQEGPNVDILIPEEGPWDLTPGDLVISGQCLEHVKFPWEWIVQVEKITKNYLILIAPFVYGEHKHPIDCWRFLPDGMKALFEHAGIEHVESGLGKIDCWAIGKSKRSS